MPWVADPQIAPCPCGAGREHQVLRTSGGDRVYWHCLECEIGREPPVGWRYDLREVTDAELRLDRARRRRVFDEREARRGLRSESDTER